MKNYKIVIISLLLLIFLVGAVSAADENATDNLEVSDEISVEEISSSDSDVQENLAVAVEQNNSDDEVLGDPFSNPLVIVVDEEDCPEFDDEYKLFYGDEKSLTFQFIDYDDNPYSNEDVTLLIFNETKGETFESEITTNDEGYATFLLDFPIASYEIYGYVLDDCEYEMYARVIVYDPEIKGYMSLDVDKYKYGEEAQALTFGDSISYSVWLYDGMMDPALNTLFYYSINNVTYNSTTDLVYGRSLITIDSPPVGVYDLVIYCPELNVTKNTTIHVFAEYHPTIIAENMTVIGGNGTQFIAKFTDRIGNPVSNMFAQLRHYYIKSNGFEGYDLLAKGTSNEEGIIVFSCDLDVGVYAVRITNSKTYETIEWKIVVLNQSSIVESGVEDLNKVSLSFTDVNGTALANGEVKFLIGNETYNATTDENGVASFDLSTLALGEYNITVLNPATGQNIVKSVSLTTNETVFADDVSALFNNNSKFSAFFTDKYGKALANTNVTFIVGNETIIATTDENGVAEFIVSALMDAGNHTVTIKNPVAGEITKTLTINKAKSLLKASDVSMTYNVPKNLVITLTDPNDGSFLSNKNVTILLNGQTYNRVTNDNGQVTLGVNLAAKSYDAKITFSGDKNYIDSQATAKINVAKATPKMTAKKATFKAKTKTKKYSIVLKDNKNKALSKVKVTIKVKGKTYKATTNSKGKATFKITKLTKKGKYTAKIKYAGNGNIKALSKSVKITIK